MRVFTRFLSIFLKEIDVLKAKTLKIFASGGSFLKEKKLTKSRYLNLRKEQNKGGFISKGGGLFLKSAKSPNFFRLRRFFYLI